MSKLTAPCPFYGMPCEFIPVAHDTNELIEVIKAALRQLADGNTVLTTATLSMALSKRGIHTI